MNSILNVPQDTGEINQWIESLLTSENFSTLIGQLTIVNELGDADGSSVVSLSNQKLAEIAETGMSNVTVDECQALLRTPQSLVDLHHRIFEVGNRYWLDQIKADSAENQFLSQFSQDLFELNRHESQTTSTSELPNKRDLGSHVAASIASGMSRRGMFSLVATLLGIGLSFYFVLQMTQSSSEWGWQSAHAMPESKSRSEYFQSLSQSGLEWFDQERGSRDLLAARLEEFSAGCQRLIDAPHTALSDEDRDWLLDKCENWKIKIDELASAARELDSNTGADQLKLKNAADDLASRVGLALSNRANSI